MAADVALLHALRDEARALPVVRLYGWDRPCVSIGRLQDEADVRRAYPDLPLVRRPTGGRAVVHGDELTISVAARLSDLPPDGGSGVLATYRLIAGGVTEALCGLGMDTEFGGTDGRSVAHGVNCFDVATHCDIVSRHTGRKLAGCAQRRDGAALLQQMSLPGVNFQDGDGFLTLFRHSLSVRLGVSSWEDLTAPLPSRLDSLVAPRHHADAIGRPDIRMP